jgi:hypothetical protein
MIRVCFHVKLSSKVVIGYELRAIWKVVLADFCIGT